MADSPAQKLRKERLAKQLRANLLRRKQQARERDEVDNTKESQHGCAGRTESSST